MTAKDDMELVREYVHNDSDEAFAALVSRHIDLVHSVAARSLYQDRSLAEEVTQATFIIFARKAQTFSPSTIISAWLCRTAQYVAADALKTRSRQKRREHECFMDSSTLRESSEDQSSHWAEIAPILDRAMAQLNEKDHAAIVLRFFEGKDTRQVANALGVRENAARTRISRALEKLRRLFNAQGVRLSAAAIAGALATQSLMAAPIGLATTVVTTTCSGTALSTSQALLITNALKTMAYSKAKTSLILAALVATGGLGTFYVQHATASKSKPEFSQSGYSTPEDCLRSVLWAASTGEIQEIAKGITAEEFDRFQQRFAGRSPEAVRAELIKWANAMKGYSIAEKEVISPDEVHLHVRTIPSMDALRSGKATIKMVRINGAWKQAGDVN